MNHLTYTERKIITKLVQIALGRGLAIAVRDEESQVHPRTTDEDIILQSVGHTDMTKLGLFNADGVLVGRIVLIHGNDEDVVSDYTDNELTREIVEEEERSRGQG